MKRRKETPFEREMRWRRFAEEWGIRLLLGGCGGIIGGALGALLGRVLR